MSFSGAVRTCLAKYATFTGRARRAEYWWFYLFYVLVYGVPYLVGYVLLLAGGLLADSQDGLSPGGAAAAVVGGILVLLAIGVGLAVLVPSLAVAVRRLHDTDRSGWWYLISFVPLVGPIILLVYLVQDSQPGPNRHGPNPKGVDGAYPGAPPPVSPWQPAGPAVPAGQPLPPPPGQPLPPPAGQPLPPSPGQPLPPPGQPSGPPR